MRIGDLSCWGTYRFLKDMFGDKKEISSCLCVKNLTHSSHHSDLGLSENRVSLNLLVNHHVRYSCRTFYYGIANVQTDPHYGWYPKKITIYIIPFITSVNMHLWYNMVSHLLGVFLFNASSWPEVHPVSERGKGIARALDHLHVVQHPLYRRCVAAKVPRPPGDHLESFGKEMVWENPSSRKIYLEMFFSRKFMDYFFCGLLIFYIIYMYTYT